MFVDIFFFHAQFFKQYPPDSANDLKKKRIVLTRWLRETKRNQLPEYWRLSHMYEEMQMEAMKTIDIINVEIPQINQVLGLATPMMHRSVFHIKKGKSYFQHSLLPDGCHAGVKASNLWAKYLNRAIVLNHS